ncbi:MAG: RNA polymerase sigma factor [Chitinophagaceae bacterium]|nr:RNA polymerase sigma factor [Chitinophagaceae bacterium]
MRSFKQFYELFNARVYNTCLSHLQNEAEAEEAAQDVFLEIHKAAASFKGTSKVSTWVYRITVNKCIDLIRYKNRQKRFAFISSIFNKDTGELMHNPPEFNHPGIVYEQKEKAAKLFGAIKQLPENQQTAFILKQVEGLSQKEVAEIMDMGEKAVESLLQRAKSNLRKMLGDMYRETKD